MASGEIKHYSLCQSQTPSINLPEGPYLSAYTPGEELELYGGV